QRLKVRFDDEQLTGNDEEPFELDALDNWIEHDRLARAGFAGDHAHAGSEFEIQVLDDGVVVNGQVNQHGERQLPAGKNTV
ncbi:hypothetical protein JNB05_31130, partial [Pseudomonas aeruginosa]|nr:hypothetical protein [Pseudomonas aeruginosa]